MKNHSIILTALSFAFLGSLHAQTVPLIINYQGQVTGGTGIPLGATGTAPNFVAAPENRKIIFRIFDAQTGGTRLWSEQQTATISLGEFSVLLGQGIDAVYDAVTESRPALDTVFTGGGAVPPAGPVRYLEIVVDDGNGTFTSAADVPVAPRQRITTSAYSFRSRIADTVPNLAIATPALADGAVTAAKVADNSITSLKILDASVTTEKIADNQITAAKIADSSVSAAKLDPAIGIWSANAGNVSRLTGNVGIGKQPVVPLDVVGDITATGAVTAGSFTTAGAINSGGPFTATTITANAGMRIPGSNVLQFGFGVPGRDSSAGQIGYGTHSGGAALDLVGAGTTGTNRQIRMWAEGGAYLYGGLTSQWYLSTGGNVTSGLNIGAGTTDPQDRVHLLGAVRIDNGAGRYVRMSRSTTGLVIEGNSTAFAGYSAIQWDGDNNWDTYSDQTLKKDITDAEPVLESLMKLPVRRYQWKDRPMKERKSFGVIAQEVKPLFPDVVGSMAIAGKAKEVMSVKYGAFGLIAAKAVQELKKEKDAEVKALQEENASLRNRLAELEARDKARDTNDKARDAKLAEIETLLLSGGKTRTRTASLKAGE